MKYSYENNKIFYCALIHSDLPGFLFFFALSWPTTISFFILDSPKFCETWLLTFIKFINCLSYLTLLIFSYSFSLFYNIGQKNELH